VTIEQADIFSLDLSPATVVTLYLHPTMNMLLWDQLAELAPGARVVSHDYELHFAEPEGHWTVMAPFFGLENEYFDAGVPEDGAHYRLVPQRVFSWSAPLPKRTYSQGIPELAATLGHRSSWTSKKK
jgi:hypothetical protein